MLVIQICYTHAMIELAILGLLKERPMHGYDLRKRLRDDFGPLANISYGSLYPALDRLEKAGAICPVSRGEQGSAALKPLPATGSLGGEKASLMAKRAAAALGNRSSRGKKIFEITDKGNLLFEEMLEDPIGRDDPRGFNLRLGFAKHLNTNARIRLLERRRFQLIERVELTKKNIAQPSRVLDPYEIAIAEHSLQIAQLDLAWIDALLHQELTSIANNDYGTARDSHQASLDKNFPVADNKPISPDSDNHLATGKIPSKTEVSSPIQMPV